MIDRLRFFFFGPKKPNLTPEMRRILRQYSTQELKDILNTQEGDIITIPDKYPANATNTQSRMRSPLQPPEL